MAKKEEKKQDQPIIKDRWTQWVALTTTILAVCAAFSSMKGGGFSTATLRSTTKESNQWQFYQAKSIKLYLNKLQADSFKAGIIDTADAKKKAFLEEKLKGYDKRIHARD